MRALGQELPAKVLVHVKALVFFFFGLACFWGSSPQRLISSPRPRRRGWLLFVSETEKKKKLAFLARVSLRNASCESFPFWTWVWLLWVERFV